MIRLSCLLVLLLAACTGTGRDARAPAASWLVAGVDAPRLTPPLVQYADQVVAQYAARGADRVVYARPNQIETLLGPAPAEAIILVRFPTSRGVGEWYRSDGYSASRPLRAGTGRYWLLGVEAPAVALPNDQPAFLILRGDIAPIADEGRRWIERAGGTVVIRATKGDVDRFEGDIPEGGWLVASFATRAAIAALWLDPSFRAIHESWRSLPNLQAYIVEASPPLSYGRLGGPLKRPPV